MSDGINIRFGKGPFGKLRGLGSFGTVSELVELAVKLMAGPKYFCISLRCKTQRFKWSSCSGASPSQLLCLKTTPHQLMGSKRKGTGPAPADLHPSLDKTKVTKAVAEVRNPG